MKELSLYLILLMICIGSLNCASHQVPVPYDRVLRSVDDAYINPDKDKMECHYKGYLDELFGIINTCKDKGLLKKE